MNNKDNFSIDSQMSKEKNRNTEVSSLSSEEIDLELAEVSFEKSFLEEQVECDLENYPPEAILKAQEKISQFKSRAETLRIELDRRKNLQPEL